MTDNLRVREMIQGAYNCVVKWGNLKQGEKVLIITDPKVDPQLIEALGSVASLAGGGSYYCHHSNRREGTYGASRSCGGCHEGGQSDPDLLF